MAGSNKTTSASTVPAYLSEAGKSALNRATGVSQIGYTPYYGPDVAAMTPAQIAAMQGTNTAASAFGLPTVDVTAGMPTATDYNGMSAYSSGTGYDAAIAELKARFPAQFAAIMSQFIDPVTGKIAGSSNSSSSQSAGGAGNTGIGGSGGGGGGGGGNNGGSGNGTIFGYTGLADMLNGGGPGKSGDTYSGSPFQAVTGGYTGLIDMINGGGPGKSGSKSSSSKSTGGSNATRR
jgi:hypothetical protein